MKKFVIAAVTLAAACPAIAADNNFKAGDVLIRARALGVMPDESSTMNMRIE